jgi:hypothetical protein
MTRRILIAALASSAVFVAGPSLAKGPGGGHGNGHSGHGGGVSAGAGASVGVGRERSQGPNHASDRAIERANEHSVLAGTVRTRSLADLNRGMIVRDTNGATIGTVSRVLRSGDGTVRNVLVRSADGTRTIPLSPGTLSVSGGLVTTTRLATNRRR